MNQIPNSPLKQRISQQRTLLYNMLLDPMRRAARRCARVWDDLSTLDQALLKSFQQIPYCSFLYAMNLDGVQISTNVSKSGLIEQDRGRDRSYRPYMQERFQQPEPALILSEAYISERASRPSVTAVQKVIRDDQLLGYLSADFNLRDLPITKDIYTEPSRWRQIKGDPAIRAQVFRQCRIQSRMDDQLDTVLPILESLVQDYGVFQFEIHFSSSRAVLWCMDDPYRYRLLEIDELMDADICLAYPLHPYPEDAVIPVEKIQPILQTFRHLRFADETLYLRAGSINIFNGIVGLNFSCDGSHYVPHDLFLAKDSSFWEGLQ